jgi:hypothetical protein
MDLPDWAFPAKRIKVGPLSFFEIFPQIMATFARLPKAAFFGREFWCVGSTVAKSEGVVPRSKLSILILTLLFLLLVLPSAAATTIV